MPRDAAALLLDAQLGQRVQAFLHLQPDGCASMFSLKRGFFKNTTYAHMKTYFRSKVDTYMVIGQNVVLSAQRGPDSVTERAQHGYTSTHPQSELPPPPSFMPSFSQPEVNGTHANGSSRSHRCGICNLDFSSRPELMRHRDTTKHRIKVMAQQLRSQGAWTANRGGVEVSELPEVDIPEGKEVVQKLSIHNKGDAPALLVSFCLIKRTHGIQLVGSHGQPPPGHVSHELLSGDTMYMEAPGLLRDVVVLEFDGFAIARKVSASCDPDIGPGD